MADVHPEGGRRPRVAIVGGGITGAVCARELVSRSEGRVQVVVFDQGGSGPGGRASHRRLQQDGSLASSSAADAAFAFDHGCQFFRADSRKMREELLADWLERGWVAEWTGRFGSLGDSSPPDFFGFPSKPPFFCSVGGMNGLVVKVLAEAEASGAVVNAGVRVASMGRLESGAWLLSGTSGKAALHDTSEEEAARVSPESLGEFDAVIVTDISASMSPWHRASAGVPEGLAARVRGRTRVCLFTALFAFEEDVKIPLDAVSLDDDVLWFAARTRAKPGLDGISTRDCWTFVSTPKYAAAEVEREPMQDPVTGAFKPQEPSYIRDGPAADLLEAFRKAISSKHPECLPLPDVAYVGGQRWGSAFPAPSGVGGRDIAGRGVDTVEVMGVAYDSAPSLPLVPDDPDAAGADAVEEFLADDESLMFYCGDCVSKRSPGVEASALSALNAAAHVLAVLPKKSIASE